MIYFTYFKITTYYIDHLLNKASLNDYYLSIKHFKTFFIKSNFFLWTFLFYTLKCEYCYFIIILFNFYNFIKIIKLSDYILKKI
jgi:hypothetical protein